MNKLIERGVAAHKAGRLEEALTSYRAALAETPDDAEANSLYGLALLHAGRPAEAAPALLKAVEREPHQTGFRMNLAEYFELTQQFERAASEINSILAHDPNYARGWAKLGDLAMRARQSSVAAAHYERALGIEPDNAQIAMRCATSAAAMGRLGEARRILDRVAPHAEAVLPLYIDVLEAQADWPALEQTARSWIRTNPSAGRAWKALAKSLWETGRLHEAMGTYRTAMAHSGRDAMSLAVYGRLCMKALEFEEAAAALSEAEALDPEHAHMLSAQAILFTFLGRFEEAEAYCRRCLARDPQDVAAYKVLNSLKRGHFSDADIAILERLSRQQDRHIDLRVSAAFVVADCRDARGEFDAAFAAYELANSLGFMRTRAQNLGYDAAARAAYTDELIARFPSAAPPALDESGLCPIFIVGMPRSGTTLVESVLAAHSRVFACGERAFMREVLAEYLAAARRSGPEVSDDAWGRWADACWADLPNLGGADHVTDKNPFNFDAVGLIAQLFRSARIIHVQRNPIETGLSIFCNDFSKFQGFANRLDEIGHYYGQYARLMAHWKRVFGDRVHTVQYEDFVGDFETGGPALIKACGLEWEEACCNYRENKRPIATISAVQVRQAALSQKNRADRYAAHLAPLADALSAAGVDLKTGALT